MNILYVLVLSLVNLAGLNKKNEPVRLEKKETFKDKYPLFKQTLFFIGLLLAFIIFICVCFMIGGTESGKVYNGGLR